ncbi:MAG TPA: EAL domain-containing protein [Thermoanaerobaculia bacterium]|nr:EAL domain-containing protein [Thermoanaerobaculia bacterium]
MSDPKPQPFQIIPGGEGAEAEVARLRAEIAAKRAQEIAVAEFGQAALTGVDPSILLGQACALVESALAVDHCRALELAAGRMVVRAAIGDESFATCHADEADDDALGIVIRLSEDPVTFSTGGETRFNVAHLRNAHGILSGAGVTIPTPRGAFGALLVYSKRDRSFAEYELTFLRWIANIIGEAAGRAGTEVALRRSESRLQQLIASAIDAVITVDAEGRVTEWNPQAAATFGMSAREVIGQPLPASIIPARLRPLAERLLERHLRAGAGNRARRRVDGIARRANGEEFPVEITLVPFGTGRDRTLTLFARDISERLRAQHELEQSERRFRTIVERSWSGVALIDASRRVVFAGPSTAHLLGYGDGDLVGKEFVEFVHPEDHEAARALFESVAESDGRDTSGEFRFIHRNGSWVWLEIYAQNLLREPTVGAIVVNYRDVTQRKAAEKQIEYQAHFDMLTGLPNRFLFRDRLMNAIALARRRNSGVAVLYLDLDHFKLVNDSLGHTFGDLLLTHVGHRLRRSLRGSDTISRVGGDEFSMVILDVDSPEHAAAAARKVLDLFEQPIQIGKHEFYVGASIGIAVYPGDGNDVETLIKCADSAMYRAKELGRNQIQLFTPSMNERYVRRLSIEQRLRHAIERGELELLYQPIYDRTATRVVSAEALLRWNDPTRGCVQPSEFIALAEESGMIVPIGGWVLQAACRQLREWSDAGAGDLHVSINVSPHQLQQPDLPAAVRKAVQDAGIDPARLQIEITETAAIQTIDRSRSLLEELKAFGVTIAIDDFGTGQSSLIYLRRFPIDAVKLDKEFLRGVTEDETAAAVVSYVISLAHALRLEVIAEGVETREQCALLRRHGCDMLQGYLLARPLPASRLLPFIREAVRPSLDDEG